MGQIMRTVIALCFLVIATPQGAYAGSEEAGWEALSKGAIVLFRHALAPGTGDPASFTLEDCSTQRNLNDEGRAQARRIGVEFRGRNLEVAAVLTSQWCRCRETAELAFPAQAVDAPAFNSFFQDRSSGPAQTGAALNLLKQRQNGSDAVVVITHQVNITALTDVFPRSGEGIVIRIEEDDVEVVGRITP
jgi:phosphohistidine phosphatase SixA